MVLDLFVLDSDSDAKIPVIVKEATEADLIATQDWQTNWTTPVAAQMPNKVALHRADNDELLGLMSYELDESALAVEIIYIENARHSNANLLHILGKPKRYLGIAKVMFAYAVQVSLEAGFGGVLVFKAKTSDLFEYYQRAFGARRAGAYDPFRLIVWEDAAQEIISDYIVEV